MKKILIILLLLASINASLFSQHYNCNTEYRVSLNTQEKQDTNFYKTKKL